MIHRLLNLAEFMEHEEKGLPIEHRTLGDYANKHMAYAKALHYKEAEYFDNRDIRVIESLISINTKLQQHDAAWGTLLNIRDRFEVTKHEEWYERLGRWQEALQVYERKAREDPDAPEIQIGRVKCYHALGEWEALSAQVNDIWASSTPEDRWEMAPMAAAAAWSLNDWDSMDNYISTMRADSPDRAFYKAILSVHQSQFPKALVHIAKARELLDPELGAFTGEGYSRSYKQVLFFQLWSYKSNGRSQCYGSRADAIGAGGDYRL
jgi:serine/threonine-protein kinase mTOR